MAMARNVLSSLLDVRLADERRADGALRDALAVRASVEAEEARLREVAGRAWAELAARRQQGLDGVSGLGGADGADAAGRLDGAKGTQRAAHALERQRFLARLLGEAEAAAATVAAFARDTLAPARAAEAAARAAHLRARLRREVVERALARRESARRLQTERRAEAATDDLRGRPPPAGRDRGGGR
jgi:hypothetical protein